MSEQRVQLERGMVFFEWIQQLPVSVWIAESDTIWGYLIVLTTHVISMGVLVGTSVILAFRLLGRFGDHAPCVRS